MVKNHNKMVNFENVEKDSSLHFVSFRMTGTYVIPEIY